MKIKIFIKEFILNFVIIFLLSTIILGIILIFPIWIKILFGLMWFIIIPILVTLDNLDNLIEKHKEGEL